MDGPWVALALILVVGLLLVAFQPIRVNEYERMVVLRFGKYHTVLLPGLRLLIRGVDVGTPVSIRDQKVDMSALDVVTKDNIPLTVRASVGYVVSTETRDSPAAAYLQVADVGAQIKDLSETEMRHLVGQKLLDEILQDREAAMEQLLQRINKVAFERWGSRLFRVSLEQIDYPESISGPMAAAAIATREGEAAIIRAEKAKVVAQTTAETAAIIDKAGNTALILTYMQTLTTVGADGNAVIFGNGAESGLAGVAAAATAGTRTRRRKPPETGA